MMALEGIRVLDLCIVLAGPTCGRTLAEYGAEVIKIDSPTRPASDSMWIDVSRGKRSMILDLSKPEGKAVFYRLLATADVVVQNFRKDVADRLGVGYEAVQAAKPDIIYASINAFGYEGPWATRPGFEQNGQAATGIQAREGGPDGPPSLAPFPVNDYGTGIMAAYAVMLALYERSRTGQGQHVDAALAYTGSLLQSPFLIDFAGHQHQDEEHGRQNAHPCSPGRVRERLSGDQLEAVGEHGILDAHYDLAPQRLGLSSRPPEPQLRLPWRQGGWAAQVLEAERSLCRGEAQNTSLRGRPPNAHHPRDGFRCNRQFDLLATGRPDWRLACPGP